MSIAQKMKDLSEIFWNLSDTLSSDTLEPRLLIGNTGAIGIISFHTDVRNDSGEFDKCKWSYNSILSMSVEHETSQITCSSIEEFKIKYPGDVIAKINISINL